MLQTKRFLFLALCAFAAMVLASTPASAAEKGAAIAAPAAACGIEVSSLVAPDATANACPTALPAVSAGVPEPEFLAHRRGYCHCGCVNVRVCRTSADCGGASCDQFISCC